MRGRGHHRLHRGRVAERRAARGLPRLANPYGIESLIIDVVQAAAALLVLGSVVASGVSLLVRVPHAGAEQRQQIKWLAYAGMVAVATILAGSVVGGLWSETVANAMILVALLGLPVSTGVAIVKHHLYDIDLVINRTLVYGSLTVMLALLYFGGVTAPSESVSIRWSW